MHRPSQIIAISPVITCLRADNPSPMTGTGTNSYLLRGAEGAVLIDPGPDLDLHQEAILRELGPDPLAAILVTHAHLDHSALAPRLGRATGAPILASGRVDQGRSATMQRLAALGLQEGGEGLDHSFAPDQQISDGQVLRLGGLNITVIATPGHLSGHLSFALGPSLFSGDHVMGWSSSLVSPPGGDMGAYMASLAKLQTQDWRVFLPGHGAPVTAPAARLAELTAHRCAREHAVLQCLAQAPATAARLAQMIYTDTPAALLPAASRNILAHLIDLHERNLIRPQGRLTADTVFELI
ncbi:MBL fold metallo-hydrolase [Cypionkella sp.]|uniref:MBL fold metallo-hydrolase n=1 Tax=Cypionkella sp. TaxID=2811411 RepID=UPI0037525DBB